MPVNYLERAISEYDASFINKWHRIFEEYKNSKNEDRLWLAGPTSYIFNFGGEKFAVDPQIRREKDKAILLPGIAEEMSEIKFVLITHDHGDHMCPSLMKMLKDLHIDLVVLAGCMIIFTQELVDAYPNAIMNVHPALIPSFCGPGYYGLHVHEQALRYGVKLSGATVHFVSAECDGGPIIAQKSVEVRPDDTPEVLQKRIMEQAEWILLPQAVKAFCEDRITVEGRTVIIG